MPWLESVLGGLWYSFLCGVCGVSLVDQNQANVLCSLQRQLASCITDLHQRAKPDITWRRGRHAGP